MRYLIILLVGFLTAVSLAAFAQDTLPRHIPTSGTAVSAHDSSARVKKKKSADSLARLRYRKRRKLDSVRSVAVLDSLRAGNAVHLKGRIYNMKSAAGIRLADSLSHRVFYRHNLKPAHTDSVKITVPAGTSSSPLTSPYRAKAGSGDSAAKPSADSLSKQADDSPVSEIVKLQRYEAVIDDSIPVFLKPLSKKDSVDNNSAALARFIRGHYHLDSLRQRLAATGPAMTEPVNTDPRRPFARSGLERVTREVWVLWVLLLVITLITLIKVRFPKDLNDIFEGLFNDRMIKSNRESGLIYSPSFILMFCCFCLTAALSIYEYLHYLHLNSGYQGISFYMIMAGSILCFFVFKLTIYKVSAAIFNIERLVQPYLSFQYITLANFTLFSVPFLLIFSCYNSLLIPYLAGWIPFIFLAFLLFLYIRSLVFSLSNFELPKFYLFLYFCTLEICPLIIVFKLING